MTDLPIGRSGAEALDAAGDGLSALGAILVLAGLWRALIVTAVLPAQAGTWWPLVIVLAGLWLASRGRRGPATTLVAIGVGLLVVLNVPGEFFWPSLLIVFGALAILGAVSGRRFVDDFPGAAGVALFSDRDVHVAPGDPAQPLVAVFGEAAAHLHGPSQDFVSCLAVFGSTTLTVPRDVVVEVRPTAVFGDVRSPAPPEGPTNGTVQVRATSVFGDVRIQRA
ncbi:hypothetical protein [Egicoccus sp. AB-alg2]|uniref:hypothetical protein n=1 Tax=Egicoccus sp. AB-alg2 TaxID=3242693 RepID=UPI00359EDE32